MSKYIVKNPREQLKEAIRQIKSGSNVSEYGALVDRALKRLKTPRGKSKGILQIEQQLKTADIQFVCEHRFAPPRKFRFDIAIPDMMIAIEYEGVISAKSGHTTIRGFTKDCQKYNLAVSLGWSVYRYTALNLNELQILIKEIHEENRSIKS